VARKTNRPPSFRFSSELVRAGTLYCVDVPDAVSIAVGVRGYVPIAGAVNGVAFRASLLPRGGGRHRILLNGEIRKAAGLHLGDRVALHLHVDRNPPRSPMPEDLADALREEGVLAAFESVTPSKREHILRWVDKAVHESTRAKRVTRVVEIALAEHEKRADRGGARN
jgi:hypothetical protein